MSLRATYQRFYKDGLDYPFRAAQQTSTLSALKAETEDVSDGNVRLVPGFGFYRYDASSTLTADDFAVLTPDTLPGRWILTGSGGDGAGILNVGTYTQLQASTPGNYMMRGVLGRDNVGDGGFGVFLWNPGDTTTADGQYVLESTVVDYRPGESKEGRWHKVVSQVGVFTSLTDLPLAHPGIYDFMMRDEDTQPEIFRWFHGDTTTADNISVFASLVSGYGVGQGNEGRWKRAFGGLPALKAYAAEVQVGSGGAFMVSTYLNTIGSTPTIARVGASFYRLTWGSAVFNTSKSFALAVGTASGAGNDVICAADVVSTTQVGLGAYTNTGAEPVSRTMLVFVVGLI